MKALFSNKGITSIQVGMAIVLTLLLFFIIAFFLGQRDSNWLRTEFEKSAKKIHLAQTMRSELFASAEAEKSSVMADTDEASRAFAEQSMLASGKVEQARVELEALIEKNSMEANLLGSFSSCWERLQEIDKEVLSLAVQNTNLKALRRSFVPAASAIKQMEYALSRLMDWVESSPNAAQAIRLASKALTGALNIYTLQAPHIAETTDAEMDRIEARMGQLDKQVRNALSSLDTQVEEQGKPLVSEAQKAYQDFWDLNAEIVDLSRQNSNIRSFDVSQGQKRNTMAQCLELLNALQASVREGATFKATK